jgi:DNA-binding CsgD family transcriptional regulator
LYQFEPVKLFGRTYELERVGEAIESALAGTPTLLAVTGEAGIGKTALISSLSIAAQQQGFVVRLGAADALDRGSFSSLLHAYDLHENGEPISRIRTSPDEANCPTDELRTTDSPERPALAKATMDLQSLLRGSRQPDTPIVVAAVPELRHRVIEAFIEMVELDVLHAPLLLVLEDLHWADPSTAQAIRTIAKRLAGYPLLIAVTARPVTGQSGLSWGELLVAAQFDIRLEPLSGIASQEFVDDLLSAPPGPRLREMIVAVGGNPLLLKDLLDRANHNSSNTTRALNSDIELAGEDTATWHSNIGAQLEALPQSANELVKAAAILGERVVIEDLALILDTSIPRILPVIDIALNSGLLRSNGADLIFRHELIRQTVEESMPAVIRAALHRSAAQVLIEQRASPTSIANHLDLAGPSDVKHNEQLREWLTKAANDTLDKSPATASTLFERARRMYSADELPWKQLGAMQIEAAVKAGLVRDAEPIARGLMAVDLPSDLSAHVRWWLGAALFLSNRAGESVELFREAATDISAKDRPLLLSYRAMAAAGSFHPELDAIIDEAVSAATQSGRVDAIILARNMQSRARALQLNFRDSLGTARLCLDLVKDDDDPTVVMNQTHWFAALAFLDADEIETAIQTAAYGQRLAEDYGTIWAESVYLSLLALLAFYSGHFDDAEVQAVASINSSAETGSAVGALWSFAILVLLALSRDDIDSACKWLAEADASVANGRPQTGIELLELGRARLLEAQGQPQRALEHLRGLWELFAALNVPLCNLSLAVDAVRISMSCGDTEFATLVTCQTRLWSENDPNRRLHALAAATQALFDSDVDELHRASNLFRSVSRHWEVTQLQAHLQTLQPNSAVGDGESLAATESGAWESLTKAEKRVAFEISAGLPNKTIARNLNLTRRTVETHVSNMLRKLHVKSRLDIAVLAQANVDSRGDG